LADHSWHSDTALTNTTATMAKCCPCQPFARLSPPKTYRSAGTSTEPIDLPAEISSVSMVKSSTATAISSLRMESDLPSVRSAMINRVAPTNFNQSSEPGAGLLQPDNNVQDLFCGISRLCRKPVVPSMLSMAGNYSGDFMGFDRSRSLTFNSTFNPCYTSSTPPDNEEDDKDETNVSILTSSGHKPYKLALLSEMSQSCVGALRSAASSSPPVVSYSGSSGFRPASWAGPPSFRHSDYTSFNSPSAVKISGGDEIPREVTESSQSKFLTSSTGAESGRPNVECLHPVAEDTHYYWELESTKASVAPTPRVQNHSLVLELNPRSVVPIHMGTQLRMSETQQSVATAQLLTSSPLAVTAESYGKSKLSRVPQMGRCTAMKAAGPDCSSDVTWSTKSDSTAVMKVHQKPVIGDMKVGFDVHSNETKTFRPHRCPTPPRVLSPCVTGDESCQVAVADI